MKSRMDRYNENINMTTKRMSREDRNKELYDHLYTNTTYTEYSSDSVSNAVELTALKNSYHTREGYQKIKEYESVITTPKVKRDLEHFQELYKIDESKVYDINSILAEAKKNRDNVDELEKKRKLRNTEYNILKDLDTLKIEQYQEEKRVKPKIEDEEIHALIDTITSKNLREEINEEIEKDLMSDLLPNSSEETTISANTEEIKETDDSKEDKNELENMDESFYTKSMDLSDQDFEQDSEFKEIEEKNIPIFVKILLSIVLIAIFTTIIYFVIKQI